MRLGENEHMSVVASRPERNFTPVSRPVHILCVDDYHLGDPLFGRSLARTLAEAAKGSLRVIIVHGGGEDAERALEGRGRTAIRERGVLVVEDLADRQLVERAIRETNKKLTAVLTEFEVPAVGIQGSDRGLLKFVADGSVAPGRFTWVRALVDTGSVPVISSLAMTPDGAGEVDVGYCVALVARQFAGDECAVIAFARSGRPGVFEADAHLPSIPVEELEKHVREAQTDGLTTLVNDGYEVRLTSVRYAISSDLACFTRVLHDNPA